MDWIPFLPTRELERLEPGFHQVLLQRSRFGMVALGMLSWFVVGTFLIASWLSGRSIGWWYFTSEVVLVDKVVIVLIGTACALLALTSWGPRFGRHIVGLLLLVVTAATILDDVANYDISFSPGFAMLALVAAVGVMPFRPVQTFLLSSVVGFEYYGVLRFGPTIGLPAMPLIPGHLVYLAMVGILMTGISWFLYRSRYLQYRAHRHVESLRLRSEEQGGRLRNLEKLKDRFFENISHELRTPLTLILGPADDLSSNEDLADEVRRKIEGIRLNAERMSRLVDQLLDLASLDAGQLVVNPEPVDLVGLVRRIAVTCEPLATREGVTLSVKTSDREVVGPFDEDAMEKVVYNLLSNALKFTPEGGLVRLRASVDEDNPCEACISVRDNGPGIPPSELPYVFDRFYHSGQVRKAWRSSGIGLSLIRELVGLHGGTVSVQSEPGFGTEFTVRLPLIADASGSDDETTQLVTEGTTSKPVARDDAAVSTSTHRVLVVDDNDEMRAFVSDYLGEWYQIREASNGIEALRMLEREPADLVIADVMMPEMDGYDLCGRIRSSDEYRTTPVVLLTARADDESRLCGLRAGADDYLKKPFSPEELLARCENLIELRRILRRNGQVNWAAPSEVHLPSEDERLMSRVRSAIEMHMSNSNFTIDWLADEVGVSRRHLQRRLKRIAGLSPGGLVRMMRLKRAAQLLEGKIANVAEAAYNVGFRDVSYFSKLFKQTFGVCPSQYPMHRTTSEVVVEPAG